YRPEATLFMTRWNRSTLSRRAASAAGLSREAPVYSLPASASSFDSRVFFFDRYQSRTTSVSACAEIHRIPITTFRMFHPQKFDDAVYGRRMRFTVCVGSHLYDRA